MSNSVYQLVTDRIVQLLEQGTVPWRRPWNGEVHAPRNLVSDRHYRGINAFLLGCSPFESPYWLTFKQAKGLGGTVRKGETSTPVIFWKWLDATNDETGEPEKRPLLRYYRVFHVTQCDLPEGAVPEPPASTEHDFEPIERAEAIVAGMPNPPGIEHDTRSAIYRPGTDTVHLPRRARFESPPEYYCTLFHELIHATGHAKRLNRPGVTDHHAFASHGYGREELIAEFGAAFLCGHSGIESRTIENSAAYIDSWLGVLRSDVRLTIHAAAAAQKAADHVLGVQHDES